MQGIITGIGFLGAGVILQHERQSSVQGVTTAASIWLVAAMGVGCGLGLWRPVGIGLAIALVTLVAGRYLERWLERFRL